MAIAVDGTGAKGSSAVAATTQSTASFTVGAGSDRCLIVGVLAGAGTPETPTAVKWGGSGGTAMTQHGATLDIGANVKINLWRLIAPTSQTSTVHVTWANAMDEKGVVAIPYTGVDQTTPLRTGATNTASSTDAISVSATSVADDVVVALAGWLDGGGGSYTATVNAGQTARQEVEGADLAYEALLLSDEVATTTSTSVGYVIDASSVADSLGIIAAALIPATGGSPATLTSATPSGTLGTSTTATLGATSDQTTGTFYGVVDSAGNISGITAAQVKAGQNNASAAAVASGNAAVSTTSPSVGVTGLTASTAYSYAVVQNNANGDSNVLTGTFTTAAAATNKGRLVGGVLVGGNLVTRL